MEKLYFDGTIITMESPEPASAVLTGGGKILAVGDMHDLLGLAGGAAECCDLKGRTMLPAFLEGEEELLTPVDGDIMKKVGFAVNRTEGSGECPNPSEKRTPWEVLRALTWEAAEQRYEDDLRGTITAGKKADFYVLDENPFNVAPGRIRDIRVLEIIREDRTVYRSPQ